MNSLTVVIGPMFSGKTSRIVHFSSKWARRGKCVIVISHSLDDREFLSHNPKLRLDDDVTVVKTRALREVNIDDFDVVAVDESQFFDDLVETIIEWMSRGRHRILVSGLDGDYQQRPFGEILQLIPRADKVHKLTAHCHHCEKRAPFTIKISESEKRVDVGGSDKYRPVCREHLKL
jgi:thymidine kinase